MKTFIDLVNEFASKINEVFPWDISERINDENVVIVDVREPYEYNAMHIKGSINAPRGILESACEYNYEETIPALVSARDKEVIVVCRSGYRSIFAAYVMQEMGYQNVASLKTGLRGWNEFEQPLFDKNEKPVDLDDADDYFTPQLRPEQLDPRG